MTNTTTRYRLTIKLKCYEYPTIDTFDPTIDASKLKTEQLFDIIAKRFMKFMRVRRA